MQGESIEKAGADGPAPAEPEDMVEALARVQEAVIDRNEGELRESIEAAIDAIDSTGGIALGAEGNQLPAIADALEDALDELEKGKVASLLPLIEQAQSIVESGSADP
ncbi:MAG: hypothetical protein WBQ75_23850 [Acetobacteraceae bacterium]